jgi:thioredoxin reductase
MQLRLERANKRAMEEQTKAEEVVEEEPITVEEIPTVTSFVLTPEEMEEHKEELEQFEAELEVAQVNTSESQQVKDDLDFSFDLSNDEDNESSSFDSDFL